MAGGILHLENKIFFQFEIAGVEVPSSVNLFRECTIHEGYGINIPTMQLVLNDNHSYIVGDSSVNDGTKIKVRVGKNPDQAEDMTFVILGIKHENRANGNAVVLNCIIDSSKYTHEAARDFTNGSSLEAMKDAFEKCGFEVDSSINTSDNMRWMNCGLSRSQYVQHIARHAYNGEQTCVAVGVSFNKVAYVRDLFEELSKEAVRTYTYSNSTESSEIEGGPILVEDVRPFTISGVFNNTVNYGHKFRHHSLQDFDKPLELDAANPQVFGAGLPLNADIKSEVEQSKYSWAVEFDAGAAPLSGYNIHKEYYKAKYLNTRHLCLFTEGIRVGMETYMDERPTLGEPVKYFQADNHGEDSQNSRYNGRYVLGGRILMLNASHYYEVHELYRSFIEEEGQTNVVGGASHGTGSNTSNSSSATSPDGGNSLQSSNGLSSGKNQTGQLINGQVPTSDGISDTLPVASPNDLSTGNAVSPKIPSIVDKNAIELSDIQGVGEALSPFEQAISEMDSIVSETEDKLKAIGEKYKSEELVSKYGDNANYLDSLSREMRSAKDALAACQHLLDIQLFALKFAKLNAGSMFKDLNFSADLLDGAISDVEETVNNLLVSGSIPETALNAPSVDMDCLSLTENAINSGLADALPSLCSNKLNLGRLNLPKFNLNASLADIEDFLRDLLCTFGNDIEKGDPTASIRNVSSSLTNQVDEISDLPDKIADSVKNIG